MLLSRTDMRCYEKCATRSIRSINHTTPKYRVLLDIKVIIIYKTLLNV